MIPIREGMEKPEYFPHMLTGRSFSQHILCSQGMMLFFVVTLIGFGLLGYLAWGNAVKPVVLNELTGLFGVIIQTLG